MNKTITTLVIIAIVLLGGYFLLKGASRTTPSVSQTSNQQPTAGSSVSEKSQQPSASQPSAEEEEHIVTYTDSGYSPSTLKIKKGETVTFKNQSSQSMWPASGVHPTHTLYPTTGGCIGSTFDACAGIQPGGSWSFKFDIAGTWKYHNHLNPGDTGTIIVE